MFPICSSKNKTTCPSYFRQRGKDVGKTTSLHFLVVHSLCKPLFQVPLRWAKSAHTCKTNPVHITATTHGRQVVSKCLQIFKQGLINRVATPCISLPRWSLPDCPPLLSRTTERTRSAAVEVNKRRPCVSPRLPVRSHKHKKLCYRLWWVDRADSRVPHAEKSPCFPLTADSHWLLSELYRKPLAHITPRPRFPNGKSILQFDDTLYSPRAVSVRRSHRKSFLCPPFPCVVTTSEDAVHAHGNVRKLFGVKEKCIRWSLSLRRK